MRNSRAYLQGLSRAAEFLLNRDNILILSHMSPDGDTIGSAFGLCCALQRLGKHARVECSDIFPKKYGYILQTVKEMQFEPDFIVAVDIATTKLFGEALQKYADRISLCIDHHPSNTGYACYTLLEPHAAATCEIIADLLRKLNVDIDSDIANCLYTGLSTDTGCFRYSSTSPKTLQCAARLIERGADAASINKRMFETSSRERMELERQALNTLEYHFDGRAAVISITLEMLAATGADESEMEGLPSLPARIEGVQAGITIKQKSEDTFKISMRTNDGVNASDICAEFGGGGHRAAAGCQLTGSLEQVRAKILQATAKELDKQ